MNTVQIVRVTVLYILTSAMFGDKYMYFNF
jgi:hypothetical protein